MQSYAEEHQPSVFPLRTVLLLLIGSIGASWWLVPRQDQLVERLFLDKQYDRMAEYLRSGLVDSSSFKPSDIRSLSADQLTLLSHLLRLTPREQLNAIFTRERLPHYGIIVHAVAMGAMRYVDVIPPDEAWQLIQPHLAEIGGAQQIDICQMLATNALSVGKPAAAAAMLSHAVALPEAGWTTCRDMTLAFRWSGQPGAGAKALESWFSHHQQSLQPEDFKQAVTLGREMAMESGNPSLAFDFSVREMSAFSKSTPIPADTIQIAYDLALQCSRTADLLPWLGRYVSSLPESGMNWKILHQHARHDPTSVTTFVRWAGLLAQFCDWNSKFDLAYDQHFRLAAAGSLASLDRCVDLSDFLGRDEDTADLLLTLKPFKERDHMRLALARLLASLGRDVDSKPLYEAWLGAHPDDRAARFEHACLLEDMGDEDAAMNALDALVQRFPTDIPAVKKLAEARIRADRHTEALRLYATLPPQEHDPMSLENYAMLAESLDDHEQLHRALQLTVKAQKSPTVENYLDLAEAASYLDDPHTQTVGLEEAIKRIPDSALLRVSLANAWLRAEDFEQAIATLTASPALRENMEAVALSLSLASDVRDPTRILDFVGADVEKRFALPVSSRLDLAVLYRVCGEAKKSDEIFATVPETPESTAMLAQAHFEVGDFEDAARLMSAHMNSHPRAGASDWIFLGEIYEALGQPEEAKRAYDYSLALLTAALPDTAFLPDLSPASTANKP